jgi:hypothetical protein
MENGRQIVGNVLSFPETLKKLSVEEVKPLTRIVKPGSFTTISQPSWKGFGAGLGSC